MCIYNTYKIYKNSDNLLCNYLNYRFLSIICQYHEYFILETHFISNPFEVRRFYFFLIYHCNYCGMKSKQTHIFIRFVYDFQGHTEFFF